MRCRHASGDHRPELPVSDAVWLLTQDSPWFTMAGICPDHPDTLAYNDGNSTSPEGSALYATLAEWVRDGDLDAVTMFAEIEPEPVIGYLRDRAAVRAIVTA